MRGSLVRLMAGGIFASCLVMCPGLVAQGIAAGAKDAVPVFEVTSVRPAPDTGSSSSFSPDSYAAHGETLRELVREAYGVYEEELLVGGPKWIGTQMFDVSAKVASDDAARFRAMSAKQRQPMLQKLLADRFQLVVHQEMRELPIYALVVDSHGAKLHVTTPAKSADGYPLIRRSGRGVLVGENLSMANLALSLNDFVPHTVVDRTGIEGRYDISLRWRRDDLADGDSSGSSQADAALPSLFTALQEELGLRLVPQKSLMPVLVIDHAAMPAAD